MPDRDLKAKELREMDELAQADSPLRSLHPLAKLIVTAVYILVTASFPKYNLSGLAAMTLYPAVTLGVSGIPLKTCLYKMRVVLPLVCAVGVLNPFLDRETMLYIGTVAVSGGVISMVTLMLKGIFCLTASFILAAATPIDELCAALRKIRVPRILTALVMLTYRYLFVMMREAAAMVTAYRLRAPGQRGIRFSAWGSFLGQMLLRSMDKAQEIYAGMRLRGFDGDFRYAEAGKAKAADFVFCVFWVCLLAACRYVDVSQAIGNVIFRGA